MNTWHKRFDTEQYMYGEAPNEFIRTHAQLIKDHHKVAAFAEGEGRNAVFLATLGHDVTTFDYAQSGLDKTQRLATKQQVTVNTVLADLLTDDIPVEQFDAAIMVFGHFYAEDQWLVLKKIVNAVKPGGRIMMELYSTAQITYGTGGPRDITWLYDAKQLLEWCSNYKVLHFFTGEVERHEGELHTGLAHTVQVIIEK